MCVCVCVCGGGGGGGGVSIKMSVRECVLEEGTVTHNVDEAKQVSSCFICPSKASPLLS